MHGPAPQRRIGIEASLVLGPVERGRRLVEGRVVVVEEEESPLGVLG